MKKIIALLVFMSSVTASASNWTAVYTGNANDGLYINKESIRVANGMPRIWTMVQFPEGTSAQALTEIDCQQERSRYIQTTSYSGRMGSGNSTGTNTNIGEWSFAPPDSRQMTMIRSTCSYLQSGH